MSLSAKSIFFYNLSKKFNVYYHLSQKPERTNGTSTENESECECEKNCCMNFMEIQNTAHNFFNTEREQ